MGVGIGEGVLKNPSLFMLIQIHKRNIVVKRVKKIQMRIARKNMLHIYQDIIIQKKRTIVVKITEKISQKRAGIFILRMLQPILFKDVLLLDKITEDDDNVILPKQID